MRDAIDNVLGEDGSAKIFDVNSFDMIGMITPHTSKDDDDGDDDDRTVRAAGRPTDVSAVRFAEKGHHASSNCLPLVTRPGGLRYMTRI